MARRTIPQTPERPVHPPEQRKQDIAVEIPSDLYGVIYTEMDDAEGWKVKLAKEFKAAKLDFDANRMWE